MWLKACALVDAAESDVQHLRGALGFGCIQVSATVRAEGLDASIAACGDLHVVLRHAGNDYVFCGRGQHCSIGAA